MKKKLKLNLIKIKIILHTGCDNPKHLLTNIKTLKQTAFWVLTGNCIAHVTTAHRKHNTSVHSQLLPTANDIKINHHFLLNV
jgi:hypothetical protein